MKDETGYFKTFGKKWVEVLTNPPKIKRYYTAYHVVCNCNYASGAIKTILFCVFLKMAFEISGLQNLRLCLQSHMHIACDLSEETIQRQHSGREYARIRLSLETRFNNGAQPAARRLHVALENIFISGEPSPSLDPCLICIQEFSTDFMSVNIWLVSRSFQLARGLPNKVPISRRHSLPLQVTKEKRMVHDKKLTNGINDHLLYFYSLFINTYSYHHFLFQMSSNMFFSSDRVNRLPQCCQLQIKGRSPVCHLR
ncbi:hypothetical protein AGLY_001958 [Aphis glycines]|uniref:Uncharacterized protein n=1 Tax=Aphis glycines TaxID=307491 RepID=A0A6G0U432_APHGL|nr:hypothetical protein AGLY_001958 [Aphis glycines]